MKIRTKLIIAFLIMILFPFGMSVLCVHFVMERQTTFLKSNYDIESSDYELSLNPITIIFNVTMNDYVALVQTATRTRIAFTILIISRKQMTIWQAATRSSF